LARTGYSRIKGDNVLTPLEKPREKGALSKGDWKNFARRSYLEGFVDREAGVM
jgi:hypothetical protein